MDKKDLDQIGELFEKGFSKAFTTVWEDNLEPALTSLEERLDAKISQLPTKAYLDDKIAGLSGDLIAKLRREDEKVNRLLDIMHTKNLLSDSDIKELSNLVVFPK